MTSETLWIRCGTTDLQDVADQLKTRLLADDDPLNIVITGPTTTLGNPQGEWGISKFLGEHHPNAMIWMGGAIDQATLSKCLGLSMPVGMTAMHALQLQQLQKRTLFRRKRLDQISFVMARSEDARQALIRAGVPSKIIELSEELVPEPQTLPCDEDERYAFAGMIGTRPTWLAAGARFIDVKTLAAAYKQAAKASHRIMLTVVTPEPPAEMAKAFSNEGLTVAQQFEGEDPTNDVEVYVAESMDELGLFFRIATITFLCGTFDSGAMVDPFGAAALGCSIISGPKFDPFPDKFKRLQDEGAVEVITAQERLGAAVIDLLSVEKTARMASAGWQVSTSGIDVLDRLEELTRERLLRFGA